MLGNFSNPAETGSSPSPTVRKNFVKPQSDKIDCMSRILATSMDVAPREAQHICVNPLRQHQSENICVHLRNLRLKIKANLRSQKDSQDKIFPPKGHGFLAQQRNKFCVALRARNPSRLRLEILCCGNPLLSRPSAAFVGKRFYQELLN